MAWYLREPSTLKETPLHFPAPTLMLTAACDSSFVGIRNALLASVVYTLVCKYPHTDSCN